jgi:hypothetical protein
MTGKKKPAAKKKATKKSPEPEVQVDQSEERVSDYEPRRQKLEHEGFDQHAAEERRQDELQEERDVHNARTAGVTLEEIEDQGVERASRGFKF